MAEPLLLTRARTDAPPTPPRRPAPRVVRRRPGYAGTVGALVALCASLTPSLLPRAWWLQAVLSGITMAIGYGAGATIGAALRYARPAVPAAGVRAWAGLATVGGLALGAFLPLAEYWQRELQQQVASVPGDWRPVPILAAAAGLAVVIGLVARGLRLATRALAGGLSRRLPRRTARVTALVLVVALGAGLGYGAGFPGFVALTEYRGAEASERLTADLVPATSPYRSGGPGSLVSWQSLGAQGRAFIAGATTPAALAEFAAAPARPPVRVYVGRQAAPDPQARARLAVQELVRTGGFDREVLGIISTTGTGWVNPATAESLEYLHGGDTALVAVQYSYLPSWVSFLAERQAATESAQALLTAVLAQVAAMPPAERPTVVVYGESLGGYAAEAVFESSPQLSALVDAALLVGPPARGGSAAAPDRPQVGPHGSWPQVSYLRNGSDPIVRWHPQLLYQPPPWLTGARCPGVPEPMVWLPVVTFWQVTVDLLSSTAVPAGHGHSYREQIGQAWAQVAPPPGWSSVDTDRLVARLG